jgi:NTP pyrophosphatase (non-canonical NTP hydrolase)
MPTIGNELAEAIDDEVRRAQKKFPNQPPLRLMAALTEEVGELAQAVINCEDETGVVLEQARTNLREEAIQVAAMAIRIVTEMPGGRNAPRCH